MQAHIEKPKTRSSLRLSLGSAYYTFKRYVFWVFGGVTFAQQEKDQLEYEYFCHQTPLLRRLRNVDMYLQYNKITNLKIAVSKLNCVTIRPGEVFSFWRRIGKPTRRRGYLNGIVLQNGMVQAGIGGGLCQLSNLIYWMTIHTPLTVIERHRHAYDVFPDSNRTQPFGSGATCFYNYGDLMIKNNTGQSFQLVLEVTEDQLRGMWKSNIPPDCRYEVYEKEHCIRSEYWGGYSRHNIIFRKKYDLHHAIIADEFLVKNSAIMMYSPLLPPQQS